MNDYQMIAPGALAGATGAEWQDWLSWIDNNLRREVAARNFARALSNCDPEDRLDFLESAHEFLRAGMPISLFGGVMEEASFWADRSSRTERKAYLLACYNRLSGRDQRAFRDYICGGGL